MKKQLLKELVKKAILEIRLNHPDDAEAFADDYQEQQNTLRGIGKEEALEKMERELRNKIPFEIYTSPWKVEIKADGPLNSEEWESATEIVSKYFTVDEEASLNDYDFDEERQWFPTIKFN